MKKLKKVCLCTLRFFSDTRLFWPLLLCGMLVRIAYCRHVSLLSRDSLHYLTKIEMWMKEGNFSNILNFDSCALPLLGVKLSAQLLGDLYWGGLVFNLCIGTLLIPAVHILLKSLDLSAAGVNFGTFLIAFNPYLIRLSCEVQRENVYLLTGILWLTCLFRGMRRKSYWLFGAGFFLALSCNSRYEAYEFLPVTVIGVLFTDKSLCCKLLSTGYCIVGFLVGISTLAALGVPFHYMFEQGGGHLWDRLMIILRLA